jgi:peptidoglycan/xylan/chitin deacetylase (PgdA/CDA1 family)
MWWDRIEYVFERAAQRLGSPARVHGLPRAFSSEAAERRRFRGEFTRGCKELASADREHAIAELAAALEVEVPPQAPPAYAPMTWEQLGEAERLGMEFGPHSVTHPILSRLTPAECEREIEGSWRRLRKSATRTCNVFCYPNGVAGDFGDAEHRILEALGFAAALSARPGYASARRFHARPAARFELPRVGFPDEHADLLAWVNGAHRLRALLPGSR